MPTPADFFNSLYANVLTGSLIFCRKSPNGHGFQRLQVFDLAVPGALQAAISFAASPAGIDCYYKYNLFDGLAVQARQHAIGGKQEVVLIVCAGIDIDSKSKNPKYATQAQNLLILQQFAHLPPSAIIGSDGPNGGLHAYWFLQPLIIRNMAEYEYVRMIFRRWYLYLSDIVPGDLDATSGPERILRPPGSIRASGNTVDVLELAGYRYTLDQLTLPPHPREITSTPTTAPVQDSVIAQYLDHIGMHTVEDVMHWAGWTERQHEPGYWDRPEAGTVAPTAQSYVSADGRLGATIKTPGTINTRAYDPFTGVPLTVNVPDTPKWFSREALYVLLSQASYDAAAYHQAAGVCRRLLPRGTEFEIIPATQTGLIPLPMADNTLQNFQILQGDKKPYAAPLPVQQIVSEMRRVTGEWPKNCNGRLFVKSRDDTNVRWLDRLVSCSLGSMRSLMFFGMAGTATFRKMNS